MTRLTEQDSRGALSEQAQEVLARKRFRVIFDEAVSRLEAEFDPAHDEGHLRRVLASALHIGTAEGADLEVVAAAAALHDVVNVPKNHPDRIRASKLAAETSRSILSGAGYASAEIDAIAVAILEHSFSAGYTPSTLESAVVQDADRLDVLGAFGVFRTASVGTMFGARFYHLEDPQATNRDLDDKKFTLDHFYAKLFKIEQKMNTGTAKAMARDRAAFLRRFADMMIMELAPSQAIMRN